MSRSVIIGDVHCRSIWKDIIKKEIDNCDKIIFLGDYTCPKEVKLDDPTDACSILYEILDFKDKNSNKVILLRGNHDDSSLGYYWAECWPKDHLKVQSYWQTEDVKQWFLKNTQWIYIIPGTNIICSHAGIGEYFLNECNKRTQSQNRSVLEQISEINRLMPSELFGFTGNYFDTRGESETQPCTWIRPYTLLKCGIKNITHIVGHTPIKHICNIKDQIIKLRELDNIIENEDIVQNYPNIWCCDCLENKEYLVIENREFKPCKI